MPHIVSKDNKSKIFQVLDGKETNEEPLVFMNYYYCNSAFLHVGAMRVI